MSDNLEKRFDSAMMDIYRRAFTEAGYKASYYLGMLEKYRGIQTAKMLIRKTSVSKGYTALSELGRLDLTVEALIFDNKEWQPLFSEEELEIIKKRLCEYKYKSAMKSQ